MLNIIIKHFNISAAILSQQYGCYNDSIATRHQHYNQYNYNVHCMRSLHRLKWFNYFQSLWWSFTVFIVTHNTSINNRNISTKRDKYIYFFVNYDLLYFFNLLTYQKNRNKTQLFKYKLDGISINIRTIFIFIYGSIANQNLNVIYLKIKYLKKNLNLWTII